MVANYTMARKGYNGYKERAKKALKEAEKLRLKLIELIDKDITAYENVSKAFTTTLCAPLDKSEAGWICLTTATSLFSRNRFHSSFAFLVRRWCSLEILSFSRSFCAINISFRVLFQFRLKPGYLIVEVVEGFDACTHTGVRKVVVTCAAGCGRFSFL